MAAICSNNITNPKMYLASIFTKPYQKVLGIDSVGSFYYLALEVDGKVEAIIIQTWNNWGMFCYSASNEASGPSEANCPAWILKLLTPTSAHWANQWREECWKTVEAVAYHAMTGL